MGNEVEGRRKSEGLVLPYVPCSVRGKVIEDLEVEGLEFFGDSGGGVGGSGGGDGGIGEDGVKNGVVWRAGVFDGENG